MTKKMIEMSLSDLEQKVDSVKMGVAEEIYNVLDSTLDTQDLYRDVLEIIVKNLI